MALARVAGRELGDAVARFGSVIRGVQKPNT